MNKNLIGGLFARGKPQPLRESAKSKKTVTPEKLIQMAFIGWRDVFKRQYPILNAIFAVPNGAMFFNKAIALSQIRQGLTSGFPDIICLAPSFDKKFHALLVEFKTEVGKTSSEQEFFLRFFAELGFRTEICKTAFEASNIVNDHSRAYPLDGKQGLRKGDRSGWVDIRNPGFNLSCAASRRQISCVIA